jgi:hypothetical protein
MGVAFQARSRRKLPTSPVIPVRQRDAALTLAGMLCNHAARSVRSIP